MLTGSGQSRARERNRQSRRDRDGQSGKLLAAIRSRRQGQIRQRLRHCQERTRQCGASLIATEASSAPGATIQTFGKTILPCPDGTALAPAALSAAAKAKFAAALKHDLVAAGYPASAQTNHDRHPAHPSHPSRLRYPQRRHSYGPQAAALVELFPTRIRYTALSVPYHIGVGWFGGFLPATAFAIVACTTGDIYAGLWYPVIVAAIGFVVTFLLLPETFRRKIDT